MTTTSKVRAHARQLGALTMMLLAALSGCATHGKGAGVFETKDVSEAAYIYAFPMLANYKALYQFCVDKGSGQYKGPFNEIHSEARVFTPQDTAIVTPNSDTPYSLLEMDLRAEPLVVCVPDVEPGRYYSVQLVDMYTFNVGYIGSRATGNKAGCYMIAGPNWKGATPAGIAKVFPLETEFGMAIFRTQLFQPSDLDNVKKVQAGYKAQPLSQFLGQPAPPAAATLKWPAFTQNAFKTDAFSYLNFLLQYCPAVPEEAALRQRFTEIDIGPGKSFDFEKLPLESKAAIGIGIKDGFEKIKARRAALGREVNGWRIGAAFGDRSFYKGDYELRAAAALAGVFGNDAVEALYPMAVADSRGDQLDGSKHRYTITFAADQYPPVNAFWSVTMYDGKTQLLIDNPINRYLINSPMLPDMKKNKDGSLTIYVQKDSPGKDKEANWLPAPNGPIYMVMRLYWPKETALSGAWRPAPIVRAD